eukprot:2211301-Rhodomonas_salina.1
MKGERASIHQDGVLDRPANRTVWCTLFVQQGATSIWWTLSYGPSCSDPKNLFKNKFHCEIDAPGTRVLGVPGTYPGVGIPVPPGTRYLRRCRRKSYRLPGTRCRVRIGPA